MTRFAGLAIFAALIAAPVAQAQQEPLSLQGYMADSYAMMRDFGRCSSLQQFLASMLDANGTPANAEQMRDFARGMRVAADMGTYVHEGNVENPTPAQVRESAARVVANTKTLDSIIELETTRQHAFAERGEMDVEQMRFCAELSKVTTQIVETLRKSGAFN